MKQMPASYGRYYEPFLGSGAVFFNLIGPEHDAHLSDTIPGLMQCYTTVRDFPRAVAERIASWSTDSETYYAVRADDSQADKVQFAARFIYLNKLCFNGLYRENQQGKFNVPYGRPKTFHIATTTELEIASSRLRNRVSLSVLDFDDALADCRSTDLVYLDPPYVAGHRSNGFVDYNAKIFNWSDQRRLASTFQRLDEAGVYVLLSNADHESIRELYENWTQVPLSRFSSMASHRSKRGQSDELLIIGSTLTKALSI